jgi:arylsulfatase A-like enzyme
MPTTTRPHIVLIVLDSVRAQSCSVHGYGKPTTPFLDELASQAVVYDNAISTAVSTVPAHASMFTGTHVSTHELFVDGHTLAPRFTTIAEALSRSGYRSFGVCYQDDVSPYTGLQRGFQQFDMDDEPSVLRGIVRTVLKTKNPKVTIPAGVSDTVTPKGDPARGGRPSRFNRRLKESTLYKRALWASTGYLDQGAAATQVKAERFLDAVGTDDPVFLYLHYDEAHLPYRPPHPYRHRFLEKSLRSRAAFVNQNRNRYFMGEEPMTDEDFAILRGLYEGAIAFLDARVRDVYKMLERRGLIDNTVFIVMGDHGDSIGEHRLMSHKFCVYDTLTRVLQVVKYPKGTIAPGRHQGIVQHTDLVPTLLELGGLDASALSHTIEGYSMVSGGNRPIDYAISELVKPFGNDSIHARAKMAAYDRRFFAVRSTDYKHIWSSDGREEFYDLRADTSEERNLLNGASAPPAAAALREHSARHLPKFMACYEKYRALL